MAICEMSKIKLLGLINNREQILDTLCAYGFIEMTDVEDVDNMEKTGDSECLPLFLNNFDRTQKIIDFLTGLVENVKDKGILKKCDLSSLSNFFVSYSEFINVYKDEKTILDNVSFFENSLRRINDLKSEVSKLNNLETQVLPYSGIDYNFSDFKNTDYSRCFFGLIKEENLEILKSFCQTKELFDFEILKQNSMSVISLVVHKNFEEEAVEKLSELGFVKCSFDFDCTPNKKIEEINKNIRSLTNDIEHEKKNALLKIYYLHDIKVLCDYYKFQIEKCRNEEQFLYTEKTFLLQGYVPTEKVEDLKIYLKKVTDAVYLDVSLPTKEDVPPTLVKNKPAVRQTEFITDLYSTPNYREMDPSKVVFFFFMLFMGIIMADVGYGFLMVVFGLVLALKIKVDNGSRRLWYIITMGGISAMVFGFLFNSFFGANLMSFSILPNPIPDPESGGDMTNLMIILLGCLGIGIVQIAVGYACKAINLFRQGDVLGAVFEGIDWVIFFVGLTFMAIPLLFDMLLPQGIDGVFSKSSAEFFKFMQLPGIIITIATVVVGAVTAGRNEKGFGKFTKGFGAVYGLISLMSDILSYARLFGLMLSGMIIAQTFNSMGLDLLNGGGIGIVFGPLIIVVGHVFNISMNVLGAYIHDSRLQYIEFFGKFYTGEGRKFTPFGSQTQYIYLIK